MKFSKGSFWAPAAYSVSLMQFKQAAPGPPLKVLTGGLRVVPACGVFLPSASAPGKSLSPPAPGFRCGPWEI